MPGFYAFFYEDFHHVVDARLCPTFDEAISYQRGLYELGSEPEDRPYPLDFHEEVPGVWVHHDEGEWSGPGIIIEDSLIVDESGYRTLRQIRRIAKQGVTARRARERRALKNAA